MGTMKETLYIGFCEKTIKHVVIAVCGVQIKNLSLRSQEILANVQFFLLVSVSYGALGTRKAIGSILNIEAAAYIK